jgi:hypothetical protein
LSKQSTYFLTTGCWKWNVVVVFLYWENPKTNLGCTDVWQLSRWVVHNSFLYITTN